MTFTKEFYRERCSYLRIENEELFEENIQLKQQLRALKEGEAHGLAMMAAVLQNALKIRLNHAYVLAALHRSYPRLLSDYELFDIMPRTKSGEPESVMKVVLSRLRGEMRKAMRIEAPFKTHWGAGVSLSESAKAALDALMADDAALKSPCQNLAMVHK